MNHVKEVMRSPKIFQDAELALLEGPCRRRGGVSKKSFYGEAPPPPEVQSVTLLYTIFHEKGTPFVYLLLKNDTSFTYLVYNFASLLTAVIALSFK